MKMLMVMLSCTVLWTMTMCAQFREIRIDTLKLERAVSLALENHPALRAADAAVRSASAGLTQSQSAYFPSITSSAGMTRTEGAFVFNPDFPPRDQKYNNFSAVIQVQQTLYDFGKTSNRVEANSYTVDAVEADYQTARGNVILNARLAYYGYIQAKQVVAVNEEAVSRSMEHLKQAKAFYTVGKRAQLDVTKAEVELANAKVGIIRANNQLQITKLQLENAMGVHPQGGYVVEDDFSVAPFPFSLDSVKVQAFAHRPEYLAARARVSASSAFASAAQDQHLPTLSASGTYTWTNFDFPLFSRWNAGITFSLPIFQGFSLQSQADQTQAAADASQANLESLAESVRLEVEQYYLSMEEARERIAATDKLIDQAVQSVTLAEKQYAAGVGSALEVTDAQLTLSNARITRIQALFDYSSSVARLWKAIGGN